MSSFDNSDRLEPHVPVNVSDLPYDEWSHGERFAGKEKVLSRLAGGASVGVNLIVVPPGKQSSPFHYHTREEEHFYVVSGQCVLRSGGQRYEVSPGYYVCFPAGTGVGHAFENPFKKDCHILAIGSHHPDDVAVYPDSGKMRVRSIDKNIAMQQKSLPYWQGEPVDSPIQNQDKDR